jgi:magnesium-transporting ATPase (P-type)
MLATNIEWDRVYAITIIYFLGLGVSAHLLDAIGSKVKPWGDIFSKRGLMIIAIISLIIAYAIGIYYIVTYNLYVLAIIAILEGFFLLAYNLELFNARFHNNFWFAISWGSLPLLAGYFIQTNQFSILAIVASIFSGLLSYGEITVSRKYKKMKREKRYDDNIERYEKILKLMSISSITVMISFIAFRVMI